ncbi:MAG: transposase [Chloroflexi bacterium]|nr:transposase [Chloroflexota bacterium]
MDSTLRENPECRSGLPALWYLSPYPAQVVRRYQAAGEAGLKSLSRRPHHSPRRTVLAEHIQWTQELRTERKLGARRIKSELRRLYGFSLSLATIHKVLTRLQVKPLRPFLRRHGRKRYQKNIPGERVQVDTCKIAPCLIQYTAIDDCTRLIIVALYRRRTAKNTIAFLKRVLEQVSFPVQRIQTDRGTEFTSYLVQVSRPGHNGLFMPFDEVGNLP